MAPETPGRRDGVFRRVSGLVAAFAHPKLHLFTANVPGNVPGMWKVLHVNDYPVGSQGGAEVLMERTLALLQAHGVATDVLTSADLPTTRVSPAGYISNRAARLALGRKLSAFRPDIVHLHNFYHVLSPGILAELARYRAAHHVRVVMTAHDFHLVCPNSGLSWFSSGSKVFHGADERRLASLGYLLSRRWDPRGWGHSVLKCAQHCWHYKWHDRRQIIDLIISPSQFATEILRRTGRPTVCLPHPCPAAPPARAKRPTRLRCVYAGRLVPEKGLGELLAMLPKGLDAEWTIIGSGPEKDRYLQILHGKGLDDGVRFLGHLPHARAVAEIAAAHVLVLPTRCPESYGLTLIEALRCGTNVLASNQMALAELVRAAGVGHIFTLDDQASLHRELAKIEASHRAGTLNRFDVSSFLRERGEENYIQKLLALYAGDDPVQSRRIAS